MAPNKLENQIKEKLNSREIQPSAQAWDRLDAMLSVAENKKPKRKINWLAIAAVFVGFTILGTIFINKNKEITTVNENVVLETPKVNVQKNVDAVKPILKTETVLADNQAENQKNQQPKPNNQLPKPKIKGVSIIKNNQNQVARIDNSKNELVPNEIQKQDFVSNQNQAIANKDLNLIEEKDNNLPINLGTAVNIKVDASSLLSAVDNEITIEYRETVFQKIGKNFQAVRVAIAERNIKK